MDDCLHAVGWCHCEPQVAPEPLPERTDAERLADLNALRAVEGNRPLDALPPESSWADADRVTFPQVAPELERCPTCGSVSRHSLCYSNPLRPDPWHRPAPFVEGEQG